MMFLIIFGSLVAAMSIASTGNIRTATMHLHVMRAMSAAETGMAVAESRLREASGRFVLSRSDIDEATFQALWTGNSSGIGDHEVLAPPSGYSEGALPAGLADTLVNHFAADQNILVGAGYIEDPVSGPAPSGVSTAVYASESWVFTPAVAIEDQPDGSAVPPPSFQVTYAPLADWTGVRIIVDGIVFNYGRNNQPIRRTITKDFRVVKSVRHAIVSHSRILVGKNVHIEGDLGARFEDVTFDHGDPVLMKSDFRGLDPLLDAKLDLLMASITASDADGDGRLRVGHPVEGAGLPDDDDFDGDGELDGAFNDATRDGYVDDFDVFIRHYDKDNDRRVTLGGALAAGTAAEGRAAEFEGIDDDLALLMDSAKPDRNENGVYGFTDLDSDGIFDADTETLNDYDAVLATWPDQELGYRDGFIDAMDAYAKVSGTMMFRVSESDWTSAQGDYHEKLEGPIDPATGEPAIQFNVDDDEMPDISADSFADTENGIMDAANGDAFWDQVASQLGVAVAALATWEVSDNPSGDDSPWFQAVWADADQDGLPDNSADAYWERSPFNAPSYADMYYRPVFKRMVFRDVQIPMGLNALFVDCEFIGATYVRCHTENTHPLWTEYGAMVPDSSTGRPKPKYPRYVYGDDGSEPAWDAPQVLPASARPPNANVLMTVPSISPLDKADIRESEKGSLIGLSYDEMPDPLVINDSRVVDTKTLSNNLRFHDCLFVGSIVSDTPEVYTQVRNKLQFTGGTRFAQRHPDDPDDGFLNPDDADADVLARSSMMLPNYSVDLGTFNSPPTQNIDLRGAIIAGVLDARGNVTITGTLLLTFKPVRGVAPLVDPFGDPVGNPAGFNASLGYFGEDEGDYESLDPSTLPLVGGVPIVGWDTDGDGLADVPSTQPQPAGSTPVPFNGYGRVLIRHDPDMTLPDGLRLPLSVRVMRGTYREGSL
jgi:hypothetical protein